MNIKEIKNFLSEAVNTIDSFKRGESLYSDLGVGIEAIKKVLRFLEDKEMESIRNNVDYISIKRN